MFYCVFYVVCFVFVLSHYVDKGWWSRQHAQLEDCRADELSWAYADDTFATTTVQRRPSNAHYLSTWTGQWQIACE